MGASLRFGKHPAKKDYRTLRLGTYLTPGLAAPPPAFDVLASRVYEKLGTIDPRVLFPMDGNDNLSDCTTAAVAHAITVFNGMIGKRNIMDPNDVTKLYLHLTNGLDCGLHALDVLNYWQSSAVAGDEILAYVSVDWRNHTHVEQAIKLFGGLYLGFQVQQGCEDEFRNHQTWVPGPLTPHGHAVFAVAYDENDVTVLTWGTTQKGSWDWWDDCVDEAYAVLPPEAMNIDYAGFEIDHLKADLEAVAN